MDERKIYSETCAFVALLSVLASVVMVTGGVFMRAPSLPAAVVLAVVLLMANLAKISIPAHIIKVLGEQSPKARRGVRALAIVWLVPFGACLVSSTIFVGAVMTMPAGEWRAPTIFGETELQRMERAVREDEGDLPIATLRQYRSRIVELKAAEMERRAPRPGAPKAPFEDQDVANGLYLGVAAVVEAVSAMALVLIGTSTPPVAPTPPSGGQPVRQPSAPGASTASTMSAVASAPRPQSWRPAMSPMSDIRGAGRTLPLTPPPAPVLYLTSPDAAPAQSTPKAEVPHSEMAERLLTALRGHNIGGSIGTVTAGPTVTQYALNANKGTKLTKVSELANDLARELEVPSVSISQVPEEGVILFRLPNKHRKLVEIDEIFQSSQYQNFEGKLALALGKTISGEPVITDLAGAPHLLIAGTTGSGKSVCINALILSLLQRMSPAELRLILIDPKMGAEFLPYSGIPHLLTPVVIDAKAAIVALKWAVDEMKRRYRRFGETGARNIDGYNAKMLGPDKLYCIVVVIDEFYDLMLEAKVEVEVSVQRLSQMARAAGIHLIMATHRPSVDVITGPIKANLPTRIGLQVGSKVDSRVILDQGGADALLGNGDMLFKTVGKGLVRAQGPYVSESRVEQAVESAKNRWTTEYIEIGTGESEDEEDAPVFDSSGMGERETVGARKGDKIERATQWLLDRLYKKPPTPSTELIEEGERANPPIVSKTMRRAAARLEEQGGLKKSNPNPNGEWEFGLSELWSLP